MSDPAHGHYRTKEEVEEHRKRDPLLLLKETILSTNLGTEADFIQLEREVGEVVTAAVKFADESPFLFYRSYIMTFWLSNRLVKQLSVLTRPTQRAKTRLS